MRCGVSVRSMLLVGRHAATVNAENAADRLRPIRYINSIGAAEDRDSSGRERMNKFSASVLIAAAVGLSAVATQAMPSGSYQTQDSLVVPVAGGCGVGFHRGPYGGCRANGYYGGRYWGSPAVVVAPGAVVVAPVGPCGGRGAHQVCGPYGNCRMVCN
jgi:hypothetical protein